MSIHGGPCVMTTTEQFYVRACTCGVVHLNFGASTINVTQEVLIAVTETLKDLATDLRRQLACEDPVNTGQATLDAPGNVIYGRFTD